MPQRFVVLQCHWVNDKLLTTHASQNVAFGMGAGLLQKVNRDTMSFATKLSHIVYRDGTPRDIMKVPCWGDKGLCHTMFRCRTPRLTRPSAASLGRWQCG